MSKKAGCLIIDLKNNDLMDSPTIEGIYDKIEGNYRKPILLSGIVISELEKADVYTQPVVSGSNYVFKNIYGYDISVNSDDEISIASTEVATRAYVDNKALLENIVDSDGNKRFDIIDDSSVEVTGYTKTYVKAVLSGMHLACVCAGTMADTTALTTGNILAKFEVPDYIADSIYPVWADNFIEVKQVLMYADDWSYQALTLRFYKQGNNLYISVGANVTLTAERSFRVEFDLIID